MQRIAQGDCETGTRAVERLREVPQQIEILDGQIDMLAEASERLIAKLGSVLAPAPPDQPSDAKPEGCSSPLAEKLRQMRYSVENTIHRLECTMRDMEL